MVGPVEGNNPKENPGARAADEARIRSLIEALESSNDAVRQDARRSLVGIGRPAVPYLLQALGDRHHRVRWGAAKALGQIGDPEAAEALVTAMEDPEFDVRWLAAQGLISMQRQILEPLFKAIQDDGTSAWLREGAHHVLKGTRDAIVPVLAALERGEAQMTAPQAASQALGTLRQAATREGE